MKTRHLQSLVVAGIILTLASPAMAADDPATTEALALYKDGKFSAALSKFQAISAKSPKNAITHYYMALCLHNLNQIAQANSEYQLAISNTKSPKLKEMCETGQQALGRYRDTRTKPASGAPAAEATDTKTAEKKDEKGDSKDKTASGKDGKTDSKDAKSKDGKTDTKTATAGAGKVKKVLVFVTSWERQCLAFEPTLEGARSKLTGKVDVQKIDAESNEGVALKEKYGVGSTYPTTVTLMRKAKR